jgi:hypothetical protein
MSLGLSKRHGSLTSTGIALIAITLAVTSCGQVVVQPTLSNSVGYEALQELGDLRRAPVHVGVLIEPDLRDLMFSIEREIGAGSQVLYKIPVGRAIAAKVVKLAGYQFSDVSVLAGRENAPPLLLHVSSQKEQPALDVDVSRRGLSVLYDVSSRVDLRLRASLSDASGPIWVGTARVTDEIKSGGLEGSGAAIDISRALAETVDRATDRLVADLMRQVRRSSGLRQYLEARR